MTNSDFARHIAIGEHCRRNTDYDEIEARILKKLKKLPSYDLDWVECTINHLIARTQQPPAYRPGGAGVNPPDAPSKPSSATGGQGEGFDGKAENPIPLGSPVRFLPDCHFQCRDGSVTKCTYSDSEYFQKPCSKRCENPMPLRSKP